MTKTKLKRLLRQAEARLKFLKLYSVGKYVPVLGIGVDTPCTEVEDAELRAHVLRRVRGRRPGIVLCHRCDNGKCVRGDHLFWGTHSDNMRDMIIKGRAPGKERPDTPYAIHSVTLRIAYLKVKLEEMGCAVR